MNCCRRPGCPTLRRSTPVTDISVWVECYCLMAAVLGARYPASASNFWAYLRRIVRCARTFDCQNWVTYDSLYRRQAAATRSLSWATEDQSLYNESFSGRAKPVARCKVCLSEYHSSDACPDAPRFLVGQPDAPASQPSSQEICRRFNEARCFASSCEYRHACSICSGNHPATTCGSLLSPGRAHPSLPSQLNRDISRHCCNARSINHECMCSPGACYYQHHVTNISSALTMVTKQPLYVARAIHNNILRNLCYTCTDDLSHYTGNTYTLARIYIYRADPLVTMYA